ncbi:MAG: hypothetical protein IID40_07685 [Planctomycetes bacterium]|nr:hypothetical protein [Planctomycetota bacterium]
MKTRGKALVAATAASVIFVGMLFAGAGGPHGMKGHGHQGTMGQVGMLLEHLEKVDAENAPADFSLERHPEADANADGRVSADEWAAFAEQARPRLLGRLLSLAPQADADGDGTISGNELAAFRSERSAKLSEHILSRNPEADTNGDGVLSEAEVEAVMSSHHGRGGPHAMKGHGHHGTRGEVGMLLEHLEKVDAENAPADFNLERHPEADANEDGTVSDGEWASFAEQARPRLLDRLFAVAPEADADGNGTISDRELAAFRSERWAKVREHVLSKNPDADTNGDGVLSEQEARAFMGSRDGSGCPGQSRGGCPFANGKGDGHGGGCPHAKG